MFKNYLLVATRNFWRNKTFSLINVLSLAIGISASLVIYLIVDYEFSFENFQKDRERIYRVVFSAAVSGGNHFNPGVPSPMGSAIQKEVTGLEAVVPFRTWSDGTKISIRSGSNTRPVVFKQQKKIVFADENYFGLVQYKWLAGSPATSLQQPYQVVLTESIADLYFPNLDAKEIIGKEIYLSDTIRTTVAGIVKDLDQNTDFTFNTFISKITLETTALRPYDWDDWNSITASSQLFIKLSPGSKASQVKEQVMNVFKKYHNPNIYRNADVSFLLQPLSDLHFSTDFDNFGQRVAHKPTLYGLLAIAVFLLVLGCINFINLTTARASRRAKEIGVRKTMGSSRKQLLLQFLSETFFLTLVATLLSVILLPLLLMAFADFIPAGLHFEMILQPQVLLFMLLLIVVISIFSGTYPAFVLSSFKPVLVLKSQTGASGKGGGAWLRKSLTICQFVIAQVFIIATILVSKQISYSLNRDLGFEKEAIVYLHIPYSDADAGTNNKYILLNRLKTIPEISMVSLSNNPPSAARNRSVVMKYKDGQKEIETNVDVKYGDTGYIKLYGMKLLAGKTLNHSDTVNSLIINETYAKALGFHRPELAIGKLIEWDNNIFPVAGVVQDFHQKSFHELIQPLVIASKAGDHTFVNIALRNQHAIGKIEKAWKEIYPEEDFEYAFLDETIAAYYKSEQDVAVLLRWATGLCILISYLGLTGLFIYTSLQRKKEIGIRKIVGATVGQIVLLLGKEFLKPMVIASAIAIPISWWSANEWLQSFAYRTNMSWWIFLAGLFIVIVISLLTLGAQTFRAAAANPVKSIRTE
jgi:putative ABC transport system permease protein